MMTIRLSLTALILAALPALSARDQPNIVLILADDKGYSDIGCYGGEIPTPHLDQLAREGLRFTQFTNTARCSRTRAALLAELLLEMTGQWEAWALASQVAPRKTGEEQPTPL